MRLIEIVVPSNDARSTIVEYLTDEGIDYCVTDGPREDSGSVLLFAVPAHAVGPIQKAFADLAVRDEAYIVVQDPEAVVSSRLDEEAGLGPRAGVLAPGRISRDELHSKAGGFVPDIVVYAFLTAISAVVAACGVLLDSVSVLIGSMVIAPLLGPSLATGVATVVGDQQLFERGVGYQIKGTVVSLVSAAAFALAAKTVVRVTTIDPTTFDHVSNYTASPVLLVAIAIGAGLAGAISLSTSDSTDLVGVMVAAALIPPVAVTGVAIAWGRPIVAFGSFLVVAINLLSINGATIAGLWFLGYKPATWSARKRTRSALLRRIGLLIALVVLLALLLSRFTDGNGVVVLTRWLL